jgi:hypothetical protein
MSTTSDYFVNGQRFSVNGIPVCQHCGGCYCKGHDDKEATTRAFRAPPIFRDVEDTPSRKALRDRAAASSALGLRNWYAHLARLHGVLR